MWKGVCLRVLGMTVFPCWVAFISMSHLHPTGRVRNVQTYLTCWCTHSEFTSSRLQEKLHTVLIVLQWLKLIVWSFITSGCQHRWICCCVYWLCWHISTICDTKREMLDSTKTSQFLLVIITRTVYPRQQLIISESEMTVQLISHIYVPTCIYAYLTCIYDYDCFLMI